MKKDATPKRKGLKRKIFDEKKGNPPLIKKEATTKCKGHRRKTPDEKRGNPKLQVAQKKDLQ
jgi:hypothetical protein